MYLKVAHKFTACNFSLDLETSKMQMINFQYSLNKVTFH